MTDIGESIAGGLALAAEDIADRKCPACGAIWKKTEPTLGQVRKAIQEEFHKYELELKSLESSGQLGYRGSVASGSVGNPGKVHFGFQPDIRGECNVGFDVDGFMLSKVVYHRIKPDKSGKRWASRLRATRKLESSIRSSLSARNELQYMKKGREGFEMLIRHYDELSKLHGKGPIIIVIH